MVLPVREFAFDALPILEIARPVETQSPASVTLAFGVDMREPGLAVTASAVAVRSTLMRVLTFSRVRAGCMETEWTIEQDFILDPATLGLGWLP